MRILLVDDTAKVRFALRVLLEHQPGLRVTGEAVTVEELLAFAGAICPDLILLDWELPGLNPAFTLPLLRISCPDVRVIALSGRPENKEMALASGADAFVSKTIPPDSLLEVINAFRQAAILAENDAV